GRAASDQSGSKLGVGRCPPVRAALTARVGQDLAASISNPANGARRCDAPMHGRTTHVVS
ncbi:MAG TPA: hypothetical protein VM760_05950, partial [Sphingomicrobium sp.]|nr:hypothetical protein [Sphingomicrobium sp.]